MVFVLLNIYCVTSINIVKYIAVLGTLVKLLTLLQLIYITYTAITHVIHANYLNIKFHFKSYKKTIKFLMIKAAAHESSRLGQASAFP